MSNLTPLCRELLDENVGRVGGAVEGHDTPTAMEERVARAKRLMQQRQLEKERVEQEKEKEKELERRALGKNLLDFKQKQVGGWVWVGLGLGWVGVGLGWVKWGLVGSSHGKEKKKDQALESRALGKNLLDFKQKKVEGWAWVGYGWVWSGRK